MTVFITILERVHVTKLNIYVFNGPVTVWHQLMFHVIVLLIYGISENQNWCLVSILCICIFHISFDNKQKILPVYIQFIVTNHKTISDTGMYPQLISNLLSKYFYTSMICFQ